MSHSWRSAAHRAEWIMSAIWQSCLLPAFDVRLFCQQHLRPGLSWAQPHPRVAANRHVFQSLTPYTGISKQRADALCSYASLRFSPPTLSCFLCTCAHHLSAGIRSVILDLTLVCRHRIDDSNATRWPRFLGAQQCVPYTLCCKGSSTGVQYCCTSQARMLHCSIILRMPAAATPALQILLLFSAEGTPCAEATPCEQARSRVV
jgi:hypothetical protein